MGLDILLLVGGLVLIIAGANYLTDGSVIIARRFNVPELVIGLTIIAVGTSAPELVVSVTSAIRGNTEMAVGNVVGSNIFNALFIIGVTALVRPIRLSRENSFKNIPLAIVTSLFFVAITSSVLGVSFMPFKINRIEGVILLLGFVYFMKSTVSGSGTTKIDKKETPNNERTVAVLTDQQKHELKRKTLIAVPMIVGGLCGLVFGGDMFLKSAVSLSKAFGISEYVISVTLMAGGTSLPELAACVMAARKGRSQLALGNVIGSNISNILLVLGAAAVISPLSLVGTSGVDILLVLFSSILLIVTPFTFKKHQIDRKEGLILIAIYVAYIVWLIISSGSAI